MDKPLYATYGDTIVNTHRDIYPKGTYAYSPMSAELSDALLNCIGTVYLQDTDIQAELDKAVERVATAEANK